MVLRNNEINSFLSATYTFEHAEGKVGELCSSQLVVTSHALPAATPVTMSDIRITFEGSMKPIVLSHSGIDDQPDQPDQPCDAVLQVVSLAESTQGDRPILTGDASLVFGPGQTRIFEFSTVLREDGQAKAVSAAFSMASELFDLEYITTFEQSTTPDLWWGKNAIKKRIVRADAAAINVLPKPPKIELRIAGVREQYYTNEQIALKVEVTNGEDVDSIVNLEVRLLGEGAPKITLKLDDREIEESSEIEDSNKLAGIPIGRIARAAATFVEVIIPALDLPTVYELSMKAAYNLATDLETPIYQSMSTRLELVNPFEANYDFSPRIHPDPWPSLFTHGEVEESTNSHVVKAQGLAQKWCLTARYASFATDELIVDDVEVEVLGTNGGIQCTTKKLTTLPAAGLRVAPKSIEEAQFDTFTQKLSLDDRGTATLDVSLAIRWRRSTPSSAPPSPLNTTTLAVPRLLVSSSEPRVLAAVSYSATIPSLIHFDVTIENPSNHFLTFGLSMEPSEKFAFSGTKQSTLQLVPLSRRTVAFRLLPSVRGEWVGPVQCVIRDRYFQKVLRIAPTEGMKSEKEGILLWVPAEDDL